MSVAVRRAIAAHNEDRFSAESYLEQQQRAAGLCLHPSEHVTPHTRETALISYVFIYEH
jgi:hypothetical protein